MLIAVVRQRRPVGTNQNAGPAANAPLGVHRHHAGDRVFCHGTGNAGIDTDRLLAVAALDGKRNVAFLLHVDTRYWPVLFPFISLEDILAFGVFHQAPDLAEMAVNADFLFRINLLH